MMLIGDIVGITLVSFRRALDSNSRNSASERSCAARRDHHLHVHELRWAGLIPGGNDHVDDEDLGRWGHGEGNVVQDLARPVVVPIVNHVLEEVCVGVRRNRREEVAADELGTVLSPGERIVRSLDYGGQIDTTPWSFGFAFRTAASKLPCPPPTSTSFLMFEKSYPPTIAGIVASE